MASSSVTLLLLLVSSFVSRGYGSVAASPVLICSVPSCLFRNGTMCDRTRQECPRCVTDDALLGTFICTGVEKGDKCPATYTLCPQTPLEAVGSIEAGYVWTPLNDTIPPSSSPVPTSLPPPSAQPAIANNAPIESTTIAASDAKGSKSGFPVWVIGVLAVAAVAIACVGFVLARQKKRHRDGINSVSKIAETPSERPTSASSPQNSMYLAADCVPDTGYARSQHRWDNRANARPHRYSSGSIDSDAFFTDSRPSDDIDVFLSREGNMTELEFRDSLGVDELTTRSRPTRPSPVLEEELDIGIYPDTAMTTFSEGGRMFSPMTMRTHCAPDMARFSIDDESTMGGGWGTDSFGLGKSVGPDDALLPGRITQPHSGDVPRTQIDSDFMDLK